MGNFIACITQRHFGEQTRKREMGNPNDSSPALRESIVEVLSSGYLKSWTPPFLQQASNHMKKVFRPVDARQSYDLAEFGSANA
jgi:hypothetical protein